jgi:hypothetical protein
MLAASSKGALSFEAGGYEVYHSGGKNRLDGYAILMPIFFTLPAGTSSSYYL